MNTYRIHTTLNIAPTEHACHRGHVFTVVRGASAEFTFDFEFYTYLKAGWGDKWYKYIEQMYFIFKHDGEEAKVYKLFTQRKSDQEFDPEVGPETTDYCKYDPERNCVSLLVGSSDTAAWELTDKEDPYSMYQYEIAIDTDTYDENGQIVLAQSKDAIIIEKQDPIVVVDSLYREIL